MTNRNKCSTLTFRPFGVLKKTKEENEAKERAERFSELLKDRFDDAPVGNFSSNLSGVNSITIVRGPKEQEKTTQLHITLFFDRNGIKVSHTISLFKDGILSGKIPKGLEHLRRGQIMDEILNISENQNTPVWISVEDDILPPMVLSFPEGDGPGKSARIVEERIKFLSHQNDLLFAFAGKNSGLRRYYGFVFRNFLVFENPIAENAAFFINLRPPINISEEQMRLPPRRRLSTRERKEIIERHWQPLSNTTKLELVELHSADRVRHKPNDAWIEQMQQELDQRR